MQNNLIMHDNLEINKEEGYVMISVNPKFYPTDVVMSAAYIFSDRTYVLVDGDPIEEIIVKLIPKEKADVEKLGREFNNELVEYANHTISAIKNAKLREAILNRVLLTSSLEKQEIEEDFGALDEAKPWMTNDPDGVAKPWEEKYGKN
ncbi:hypothetical protein K9M79_04835 [Candidatus Woesearchaeota archaeon]|nr:hypothetical protein [Candidatus Woesearchaeota archaeon]